MTTHFIELILPPTMALQLLKATLRKVSCMWQSPCYVLDYNKLISLFPSGERLLLFVQTQSEIQGTSFNRASLLDNSGGVVQTLNLTSTGDGGYIVSDLFTPPEIFQLQIHGFDSNGNPISRISSSGVQTVDVDLRLGKLPQYVQHCVP